MTNFTINIVIVTYNSEKHIEKCIDSIAKNDVNPIKHHIIIVDNNSNDNTVKEVKKLQKKYDTISLIENKKNTGFAKAVNQGIRKSIDRDYILLLNPDTILEKNSLLNLVECSENNNAGISGGSTQDKMGNENGSYFRFPNLMVGIFDFTNFRKLTITDKWHKYFYYLDSKKPKSDEFPVDVVTGGYMLIKNSTIDRIGYLDEEYFMYLEDVDYCLRAKNADIKTFHTNSSKILHIGGASSDNKDKIRHSSWLKSRKIFFAKHFGLLENIIIQPLFLIDDIFILSKIALQK